MILQYFLSIRYTLLDNNFINYMIETKWTIIEKSKYIIIFMKKKKNYISQIMDILLKIFEGE